MTIITPTEGDYFADDEDLDIGRSRLQWTRAPRLRSVILEREAAITARQAGMHLAVFGDDPDDYDEGIPPERWLTDSARLLRIIANAESCRITGRWTPLGDDLEHPVADVLRLWANGLPRRPLTQMLCGEWYPLVGGQAVEAIATLPYRPRMPFWMRAVWRRVRGVS